MKDTILIGRREKMLEVPADNWRKQLAGVSQHSQMRLSFMTVDHHRVRNLVVRELPCNQGKPLSAGELGLSCDIRLDTPSFEIQQWREYICGLSGGCDCNAFRARALT